MVAWGGMKGTGSQWLPCRKKRDDTSMSCTNTLGVMGVGVVPILPKPPALLTALDSGSKHRLTISTSPPEGDAAIDTVQTHGQQTFLSPVLPVLRACLDRVLRVLG